ncbi:MAG: hypothetical protein AAF502_21425 [Bacteroidota bacterium]
MPDPIKFKYSRFFLFIAVLLFMVYGCKKDPIVPMEEEEEEEEVVSPVVFNPLEVPYDLLSTYKFFTGNMSEQMPSEGVLPYEPITSLFTDYAHKSRFIWMPDSVSATYVADHKVLDFPDGTVLIKTFFYNNVQPDDETKIIETRLIFKRNGNWEFANYVWNEEQTEATFDLDGSYVDLSWSENSTTRSTTYRIPSDVECLNCHKNGNEAIPIGPKPQNLNKDLLYTDGTRNQLQKWSEKGLLSGSVPGIIDTVVDWEDTSNPIQDRVRAYLDMNCSHCHADQKYCDYRAPRFAWSETIEDANLGICVEPADFPLPQLTHIVSRGNILRSAMHYRMNSTDETVRMPLLGRTLVHQESVQMIEEWINTLEPNCN